jgi:hypothetical protein
MSGDGDDVSLNSNSPDQLLAEWFTKSFVNDIGRDITMGGVVMEE